MSYHPTFTDDAPQAMDTRLMLRLTRYLKPYWPLLLLSLLFMGLLTLGELVPPLLTRIAVDRYIMPSWAIISENAPPDLLRGARLIPIPEGGFMVNLPEIPQSQRRELEARGLLSSERYIPVPPELSESLQKGDLIVLKEGSFIAYSRLKEYDRSLISRVRAGHLRGVGWIGLALFLILTLNLILNFGQVYTLQKVSQRGMADLRQDIFSKFLRSPVEFFSANPVGRLVTRATNDVESINEFFSSVLVYLIKDALLVIGIIVIMIRMNIRLTGAMMAIVPLLGVSTFLFRRYAREAYREVRKYLAQVNATLQESVSGISVIQAFVQEGRMTEKFRRINYDLYKAFIKQLYVFGTFRPLMDLSDAIAVAIILWYGGGEIIRGALSFGALVAFLSYIEMLFAPIRDLSEKYNIMQSAFAAGERIFKIMDGPEEPSGGKIMPSDVKGQVRFEGVWFAYEGENWVLRDISFEALPGQTIAIVGPTGAGKTTIIKLLLRFHDPQRGRILIDGTDIRDIPLRELRSRMALVQQDIFVFSGTIEGNIRLRSDIPIEKVIESAKAVDADRFIERLDGGYKARVAERGSTLSQGQRQLLAFARALAFDPKILLLDEATANIDQETEEIIQRSLRKLLRGRTSFVVAHRLSTIREADKILVIQNGRLVEEGNHEELIQRKGFYYYLYSLQFERNTVVRQG
ncbi:MAG: ABC transporter ATP-binding protein [candidate division WOR-3 bacterium]